eukprot:8913030-Lingulodinium_polyedra.AAC.1
MDLKTRLERLNVLKSSKLASYCRPEATAPLSSAIKTLSALLHGHGFNNPPNPTPFLAQATDA